MLVAGVSFGQQAHHDPSLAGGKHSFSLNQECQSFVFQSFFPQKRRQTYMFSIQSLDRLKTADEYKQK